MSFPKSTHTIDGMDVGVTCERVADAASPTYQFTAVAGNEKHEHRMTIGQVDGECVIPTEEQLQRDVDAARLVAARHARARHAVSELESKIK
jgi:hypothetical protein